MNNPRNDLARIVLSVIFIGLLILSVFWVLRPFLAAIVWATMIVVTTWPLLVKLQRAFGGRRGPAVTVLTLGFLLIFIVPFFLAVSAVVANADKVVGWAQGLFAGGLPAAPEWVARVPLVGGKIADTWNGIATSPLSDLTAKLTPYLGDAARWFLSRIGGLAGLLLQLILTAVVSGVFWASGDAWGAWMVRFGRRLAGDNGESVIRLSASAIRGVAMGVVLTALIQSTLGAIGLAIAGIPMAVVLGVVMFVLAIAQLGPLPVLLPAVIYVFWSGSTGWGAFLLVWSLIVIPLDNIVRPILIKSQADLPFLLIFSGVIGGLAAFGLVGIFIGPVALAVAHALINAWVDMDLKDAANEAELETA